MRFSRLTMIGLAVLGMSTAADASLFGLWGAKQQQHPRPRPVVPVRPAAQPVNYRWSLGAAPQAYRDMVAELGTRSLKPGHFIWADTIPTEGETRVVLDLKTQMAYVYRGERLVGATTISSARRGMVTPLGNWKVLEKRKFYRSRKYDNAPMPFMQRIDQYGIAFHGGNNPGYPASHGCVRMPLKFAEKLYGLTTIGSPVTIEG